MGYLEYTAMLVSPSPKDTLKAIEARHKNTEAAKKHRENTDAPIVINAESGEFENTTFYSSIETEVGKDSAAALMAYLGDKPDTSKRPVSYIPKPGQLGYFEKAIAAHQKGEDLMPGASLESDLVKMHLDSITF